MFTKSIWNSFASETNFPALIEDISVDVAIIGGGITGITTALLLKEQGLKVAVLEAKEVGKGTTGHSTGNLYVLTDQLLSPIKEKYDKRVLQQVLASRREAFDLISRNIHQHEIDCDYKQQSMFVYEDEQTKKIANEWEVAVDAGIPLVDLAHDANFPFEFHRGVELPEQATFNPLRYVQGLANKAQGGNCTIYENTRVSKIEEEDNQVILSTPASRVIAKYAIHATHTPKGVEVQYHTVLGPYREYGVAVKLQSENYPQGIYWEYKDNSKYSIRTYTSNGENFLLCIGSPHKVGQAKDNLQHIQELLKFLETKYSIKEVTHQWGGQHYKPADLLPYIGPKSDNSNQYVATGFSTDGLIYGTLSAILISDAITGKTNEYAALFEASRHQPAKAAKEFLKENIDVAAEFVKGLFKSSDKEISDILPGEAKIIQKDSQKAAVYRDKNGVLSVNSAICTHMGCVVHWNNAEESWDCPCHGSRFNPQGDVIEGPAINPLEKLDE